MALFNLGFRPFFVGAGFYSILSIILWSAVFIIHFPLPLEGLSTTQWHAHEMIYGYSMAVIAGFLLTAVRNWTGEQTLSGIPLAFLFGWWAVSRLIWLTGTPYLSIACTLDILFLLYLLISVSGPIIKVKQWKQLAILGKLSMLMIFNILFYLGVFGILDNGVYWGLYGGLYLVIGLILTMARRVIPFFIEKGVGYPVKLFNSLWLDMSSLVLFLAFFFIEVFFPDQLIVAYLALGLFIVNAARLIGWHTSGIWKKPLLWSIYVALWFITLGFLLLAGVHFAGLSKYIAIHAMAVGGIGLLTVSMMSRVALGHTGRNISSPPGAMNKAFIILLIGTVLRVIVPMMNTNFYILWIALSQVLWVLAFSIFTFTYLPILLKPRLDGQPG